MTSQRDNRMSQQYWDDYVRDLGNEIIAFEKRAEEVRTDVRHYRSLCAAIFLRQLQRLIAQYSAGASRGTLQLAYPAVIDAYERRSRVSAPVRSDVIDLDTYVHALWLLSFGVLLDASDSMIARVVELLNKFRSDVLFDRLVALRLNVDAQSGVLLYPQPYALLYQAITTDGDERERQIHAFLKRYYRGMRPTYWYKTDRKPETGYFGYWCFELAAFVKVLTIPDQSFRNDPYYPRDLVRYPARMAP